MLHYIFRSRGHFRTPDVVVFDVYVGHLMLFVTPRQLDACTNGTYCTYILDIYIVYATADVVLRPWGTRDQQADRPSPSAGVHRLVFQHGIFRYRFFDGDIAEVYIFDTGSVSIVHVQRHHCESRDVTV